MLYISFFIFLLLSFQNLSLSISDSFRLSLGPEMGFACGYQTGRTAQSSCCSDNQVSPCSLLLFALILRTLDGLCRRPPAHDAQLESIGGAGLGIATELAAQEIPRLRCGPNTGHSVQ